MSLLMWTSRRGPDGLVGAKKSIPIRTHLTYENDVSSLLFTSPYPLPKKRSRDSTWAVDEGYLRPMPAHNILFDALETALREPHANGYDDQTWRNETLHECSHALIKLLNLHPFHALYLLHGECFSFLSSNYPGGRAVASEARMYAFHAKDQASQTPGRLKQSSEKTSRKCILHSTRDTVQSSRAAPALIWQPEDPGVNRPRCGV